MKPNVTDSFTKFATEFTYDRIPKEILHETKRAFLNHIGIALGGIASDKGKIGIELAHKMGGVPESSVLAVGGKCAAGVAAFANSELMNGLDMDAVAHIPPIVFPAVLAVGEARKSSGKDFLAALTVSQEISKRLSNVLLSIMGISIAKYGKTPDVFGNSNEHIIGAAVGNALLMGLGEDKIREAMGIAAYFCSLPICRDWESTNPKSMIKYCPTSWMAQGSVQAAQLAELGYTGNAYTLDGEFGFPKIYCREDVWDPEKVLNGLGETWLFPNYHYKPYPSCTYIHSSLDAFEQLQEQYHFAPQEIEQVRCYSKKFVAHPDQHMVTNQIDLQFSTPYCVALLLMGYKSGPAWQDKKALSDPLVREIMKKVVVGVAPEFDDYSKKFPGSWYARVEVDARGETFTQEQMYSKGTNNGKLPFSDEEFIDMYRTCASYILPDSKIERSLDLLWHLEELDNLDELMENLTL